MKHQMQKNVGMIQVYRHLLVVRGLCNPNPEDKDSGLSSGALDIEIRLIARRTPCEQHWLAAEIPVAASARR